MVNKELSPQQLAKLKQHTYSCTNCSLFDPFMQVWWCWLVQQFPLNIAPNLITVIGLLVNVLTSLLMVYFSPYADQEVPRWACLLCCLGLFIYQSLDAIDGKQARRTNSQSPLGELFDHGCDSLSTLFVSVSVCCAVQLGKRPYWLFCQCMMAVTLFYCAHWQTYVSGKLRFGRVDVTEAQFGVMLILLISTLCGSSFWSYQVPALGLTLQCLPTIFGFIAGSIALFNNFQVIFIERGAGRNGSTVAGTSVLSPMVPLLYFIVPALMVAWKSSDAIFLSNPLLYMFTFGLVAARVSNRLVVAHMTKHEMAYTDSSMLGPAALLLNQFFNSPVPEHWLLWLVFFYVTFDLLRYVRNVCMEICVFLNIELFRIPGPGAGGNSNGSAAPAKHDVRAKGRGRPV
ncbi:cholinephosphotransferase 1-like isoform X4 [Hyalella azteca]|uniref:diacylglycerol cholinephosphotransferase n=1 Tax=Hyalella azteca TaxID=294128 RepID=A0A8B7NXC2_HYAAZ|nr:cholinephosphotransferase 1-like isoform X4 [Hyalella azteca]